MTKQANNTHFFYQNGKLVTVNQGEKHRAIFRSTDIPLAEHTTDDQQETGLLSIDQNGSVLNVSSDTDDEEPHSYSGYGHDPSLPSNHTIAGFNGERIEAEAAGYLLGNGYRLYSPVLMRFLAADSSSPFDEGGLNAYCYCLGDPINRTDPDGHFSLFKTRTWFRSPEEKIAQRLEALKLSNEKIPGLINNLERARNNRAKMGRSGQTFVNAAKKELTAERDRAKSKIQGITKHGKPVDATYRSPGKDASKALTQESNNTLTFSAQMAENSYQKRQEEPQKHDYWRKDPTDKRNFVNTERDETRA